MLRKRPKGEEGEERKKMVQSLNLLRRSQMKKRVLGKIFKIMIQIVMYLLLILEPLLIVEVHN